MRELLVTKDEFDTKIYKKNAYRAIKEYADFLHRKYKVLFIKDLN